MRGRESAYGASLRGTGRLLPVFVVSSGLLFASGLSAQGVLTGGLAGPLHASFTPGGNVLVAETGTGANDGRVVMISAFSQQFPLLSGLPSVINAQGPNGPNAVAQAHRRIYILLGEGDAVVAGPPPTQAANPAGTSVPIFSSLLAATFTPVPDGIREGFTLDDDDLRALADGHEVVKVNDSGERVELFVLADFRDTERDPDLALRQSNPFHVAVSGSLTIDDLVDLGLNRFTVEQANFLARLDPDSPLGQRLLERTMLYVADAGMNTLVMVEASSGRQEVLNRVGRLPNPLFPNLGGPTMDSVTTSVFPRANGKLLLSILTGFPFPAGAATIFEVDPDTGARTPLITGLTTVTSVIEVGSKIYVACVSTDLLAGAPGQILEYDDPAGPATILADGVIGPTGMVYDPFENRLVVVETFTGRVLTIPLGG